MPTSKTVRKKNTKALQGKFAFGTPKDLDNMLKFYLDVLNNIAIDDDKNICSIQCEKRYDSENPRVEIDLKPIGENMVKEHAATVVGKLSEEQLDYIIKKANRLGWSQRSISRVFTREDDEGRHIFFDVSPMQEPDKP